MSVVDFNEVVSQVFDAMAEGKERGEYATKVLMSQRQYDAFQRSYTALVGGTDPKVTLFAMPIVICPDCDLYVVFGKVLPDPEPPIRQLPTLSIEKNVGGRFS